MVNLVSYMLALFFVNQEAHSLFWFFFYLNVHPLITSVLDALSEWPLDVFLVHYGNEVNDQLGQHLPPRGTAQTAISTP